MEEGPINHNHWKFKYGGFILKLFLFLSSNINYIHGGFENNVYDLKKLMVNHYSHKFDLLRPKCCKTHDKPHNNIARKLYGYQV
jgi:hypothetical protein